MPMPDEYYIRKSDVEQLIGQRIRMLRNNQARGKGLQNAIINLGALREDLDGIRKFTVTLKEEPTIFKRKGKDE